MRILNRDVDAGRAEALEAVRVNVVDVISLQRVLDDDLPVRTDDHRITAQLLAEGGADRMQMSYAPAR